MVESTAPMSDELVRQPAPKLAIASTGDARSPHTWSGTPYYMASALEAEFGEISYISPVQTQLVKALSKVVRLQGRVTGAKRIPQASWFIARQLASTLESALERHPVDVLFAPAGSALLAGLKADVAVIYSSDATVRLMTGYYGQFSDLTANALREAEELEAASIARADLMIYPTEWVARSAIEDYGADPAKVFIQPYGANLHNIPERATALAPRAPGPLRLIFVGVDWDRKGGAIAVAALQSLIDRGVEAHLTVVGCVPPPSVALDHITVFPFLSKNDPEEARKLSELYCSADLLFVPTRAECYGVVWCEAAAHGLPSISTATGGVTGVIREGVTGYTLPPAAEGAAYADLIAGLIADPTRLERLKTSARDDFETRLDWTVWGQRFRSLMLDMLETRRRARA